MPIRSLFRFLRPAVGIDNQAARDRARRHAPFYSGRIITGGKWV
ncbi:MAG: hypothetical protein WCJ75_14005 [Desulfomonile sp.]